MERKGDDAAEADLLAGLLDSPAVDPDMTFADQGLGERSAFHQPYAMEIAIDPHFFRSLASSAKAWLARFCSPPGRCRRPRHRQASPARVNPTSFIRRAIASSSRPMEVASAASTGSAPPAERTLRAWLASRSARSILTHLLPARR